LRREKIGVPFRRASGALREGGGVRWRWPGRAA